MAVDPILAQAHNKIANKKSELKVKKKSVSFKQALQRANEKAVEEKKQAEGIQGTVLKIYRNIEGELIMVIKTSFGVRNIKLSEDELSKLNKETIENIKEEAQEQNGQVESTAGSLLEG